MADRTIPLYPRSILQTGSNYFASLINATAGIITSMLTITGDETVTGTNTNNGNLVAVSDVTINGDIYVDGSITVGGSILTPMPSGSMMPFIGAGVPSAEWILCDGASYPTATYPDLFGAIGYTFGGAGANFNVPDMRGRVAVGQDLGAGILTSNNVLGNSGGSESHSLTAAELPNHIHPASTTPGEGSHTHAFNGTSTTMPGEGSHTNSAIGAGGNHTHTLNHTNTIARNYSGAGASYNMFTFMFDNTSFVNNLITQIAGGVVTDPAVSASGGGHTHIFTIPPTPSSMDTGHTHNVNSVSYEGASNAHQNLQPYLVFNYVIKT